MALTVAQLVEELQKLPQDLPVYLFNPVAKLFPDHWLPVAKVEINAGEQLDFESAWGKQKGDKTIRWYWKKSVTISGVSQFIEKS